MSVASNPGGLRWASRVVRGDAVVIAGRTYRPVSGETAYTGQLDGHFCLFSRYVLPGRSCSRRLTLYGVWDPGEREYVAFKGPHVVDGRFSFMDWVIDGDEEDMS